MTENIKIFGTTIDEVGTLCIPKLRKKNHINCIKIRTQMILSPKMFKSYIHRHLFRFILSVIKLSRKSKIE